MASFHKMAFAAAIVGALALPTAVPAWAQDDDPVVAVVDDTTIRLSDLAREQMALPDQYRQMPMPMLFDLLRTRAIETTLLASEANRRDLTQDPEVRQALADLERAVLRNRLVELTFADAVSEEKLQARFDERAAEPGFSYDQVRASHILVETEDDAAALIAELADGADFAELAREHSRDPAGANGGDLGWFVQEQMVEPFAVAAFAMEPGTVSAEPVETQFGWHVIQVADRRTVTPTFEQLEPELREALGREALTALLQDLRDGASIERFGMDGEPVAE